jgi:uncharacterized coiled-coil protein SlyX
MNWYRVARWLTEFTEMPDRLKRMETTMAADRELLTTIAQGLTALNPTIAALVASEAALRARVVELEGQALADEVGDLAAAAEVKAAFDGVASQFTAEPSVPDVEPLPDAEPSI